MEARHLLALALSSTSLVLATGASAQEFRIETDVYVGDEEAPSSHTVTLFERTAVYEFIDNPEQVIIYRQATGDHEAQFILLDPESQRRTEVNVERVTKLMGKLASWAAEQDDPVLRFSGDPEFEESFDAETGSLTLSHPEWTYSVATVEADDPAALARYRDFTDRYSELTAMLHSSPPPGPRQALNAVLASHGAVPVEIRRTIGGDEDHVVRAVHLFAWQLSRDDRALLDEAQKQLANYVKVGNEEFLAARTREDAVRGQSE
jgi:hypothetical protein